MLTTQAQTAASPCQEAILRCCSLGQKATSATHRCFEQNNCGGLFTAHEEGTSRSDLGACAYFEDVLNNLDYDYDDSGDDLVGVRTVTRPDGFDEQDEEVEEVVVDQVEEELAAKETSIKAKETSTKAKETLIKAKETLIKATRPRYSFQNGFFYHHIPPPFYGLYYGHFQRYPSALSYPYTHSYYLL